MALYDNCSTSTAWLASIGIITLIFIFIDTIWNLLQFCRAILAPYLLSEEPQTLAQKFGSWALITGCTDGIGKAYAKELASRGINLILVSRTEEKLKTIAKEIESEYLVKTKIIPADFSTGPKAIAIIKDELKNAPPIGILVNNVGKQYSYPMFVGEVPEQELWDIININVGAVTLMTRLIVEGMRERGRGAIVNVASAAECQPLPLTNVYAASKEDELYPDPKFPGVTHSNICSLSLKGGSTYSYCKVYIKYFSEALRAEYAKSGITVQHLSPFFISTKMNHFSDRLLATSFFVPDATTFAKYAVNTLGKVDHSTGYWPHGIQHFLTNIPPRWIRMRIGGNLNSSLRKEYRGKGAKGVEPVVKKIDSM